MRPVDVVLTLAQLPEDGIGRLSSELTRKMLKLVTTNYRVWFGLVPPHISYFDFRAK